MASKKNKRTRNAGDRGSAKKSSPRSSGESESRQAPPEQHESNNLDLTQAASGGQGSGSGGGGSSSGGSNGGDDGSINTSKIDFKRRRMLVKGASVVGGLGAVALAAPMVASMSPSARAKAAGAPVEADISKLEPGRSMTVEWRGKPVWMVSRTPEALASLAKVAGELSDPDCDVPQQPEYAKNETRSIKPEILVMVGICTHLGCSPTYRPEVAPADLGPDWLGGFFCPCHGSKFDFSGRVYAGVPAPTNLEVPPHQYLSDSLILIGVDQEGAAA